MKGAGARNERGREGQGAENERAGAWKMKGAGARKMKGAGGRRVNEAAASSRMQSSSRSDKMNLARDVQILIKCNLQCCNSDLQNIYWHVQGALVRWYYFHTIFY